MLRRLAILAGMLAGLAGILLILGLYVTPWPGVWIIRAIFDHGAAEASARLEDHVPPGIRTIARIHYDARDGDAYLDIYRPAAARSPLPVILWIHGGGFLSGRRGDVANYAKILAGAGFAVASIDYSLAPGAIYPTPVRQANAALGFLVRRGANFGIDPERILIAGDSAGAQIAAQVANLVTAPDYARRMRMRPAIDPARVKGLLLFCGPYDLGMVNTKGTFGLFVRTVLWSYSGKRDYRANGGFALMSVSKYVTGAFPPAFITAGNADPLEPQSHSMTAALRRKGVAVETFFFPPDYKPPLGHEYQFDLDGEAGQQALERAVAFARRVTAVQLSLPAN